MFDEPGAIPVTSPVFASTVATVVGLLFHVTAALAALPTTALHCTVLPTCTVELMQDAVTVTGGAVEGQFATVTTVPEAETVQPAGKPLMVIGTEKDVLPEIFTDCWASAVPASSKTNIARVSIFIWCPFPAD
jgi:hypothetical protein